MHATIGYPDTPLSEGHGAGARLSPEDYDGPPPGAGREPRFVLYATETEEGAALSARFPTLVEGRVRKPPEGEGTMLVRPDGYVGFTGGAEVWDEAGSYLLKWRAAGQP